MVLFTALTVTSGVLAVGAVARRKATPPRLVDALVNGKPEQAMLLPAKQQQTLTRVRHVAQDLFGDTRKQQQQALNSAYETSEDEATEAIWRQNLIVASGGLGLDIGDHFIGTVTHMLLII